MIFGVGTDIIEIERIDNAIKKNNNFLKRFFSEKEIIYFEKKKFKPQTIAGNFAAKEAVSKALGRGFSGFEFIDIEILRDEKGKPICKISNKIENLVGIKNYNINVSISHNKTSAISFAVIEEV